MKKNKIKLLIILLVVIAIFAIILGYQDRESIESQLLGEDFEQDENEINDEELEEIFNDELLDLIEET